MKSKTFRDIRAYGEYSPDWEVIVDYVGETFVAKGYAKREYSGYIKKDMVENKTYTMIAPHFTLLRSTSEYGALGNVFRSTKLGHPVEFGHENNGPVAYAITFTSVDADSHVAGISLLAGMLIKEEFVEGLPRVSSDESLAACTRRYREQEKNILKVNTVCISGMESSLILKATVEKAFKKLGIDAQVTRMDAEQFKDCHLPNVRITTPSLARTIGEQEGMVLITTESSTDVKVVKEKIREVLNIEEQ